MSINEKTCTKCGETFPATTEYFYIRKRSRDGLCSRCKKCLSDERRERTGATKRVKREVVGGKKSCSNCNLMFPATPEYFQRNSASRDGLSVQCGNCRNAKRRERRKTDSDYLEKERAMNRTYSKKSYWKSRTRRLQKLECNKKYRKNNREKINSTKRTYERKKRKGPAYRLKKNISTCVYKALKCQNKSKNGLSTFSKLPYTPEELCKNIESKFDEHMNWDNHGTYWHLHHIIFQQHLPYDSMDHPNFLKCWDLSNLIPVSIEDHKKIHSIIG